MRETAGGAEDFTYELIVLRKGRPVLPIQRNEVDVRVIDDDAAELIRARLHAASAFLRAAIPAVGRIEVQNNPFYDWVGTGWLVAPEVIVTNRHVAQAFGMRDAARFVFRPGLDASRPQAGRIDFLEEIGLGEPLEVALAEIVWIAPDAGPDVAFLRLAAARPDVAPIALADAAAASGAQVAVIGYPARDSRVPNSGLMDDIFGEVYDKKRLAPGQLTLTGAAELQHDCTTLGGNSGSVLLDLATGKAAGLHFSGVYLRSNYAVPASVVGGLIASRPWQGSDAPDAAPGGRRAGPRVRAVDHPDPRRPQPRAAARPRGPPGRRRGRARSPRRASVEAAAEAVRTDLAGNPAVVSVRPGYAFRDGWITPERAVVVRLRPGAGDPGRRRRRSPPASACRWSSATPTRPKASASPGASPAPRRRTATSPTTAASSPATSPSRPAASPPSSATPARTPAGRRCAPSSRACATTSPWRCTTSPPPTS